MTRRPLACESLEARNLMAVASVSLSNRVLKINMDDLGGDVRVYTQGAKIMVKDNAPNGFYLTAPQWPFNKSAVGKIEFRGGDGNDVFDNDAFVPVEAWGNDGNDSLNGGNAADILRGGEGNDTLIGVGGDDRLYGGDGRDVLFGDAGNDSLYGGGWDSVDQLTGGAGRDRFLTQSTDVIKDGTGLLTRAGDDAQIKFVDRDQSWSNREIEVVDEALAQLFAARGDNRLLKETRGSAPLTFYQGQLGAGVAGHNQVFTKTGGCWQEGPWYNPTQHCDNRTYFDRREIVIVDWDTSVSSENRAAINTVIHEIGHNFDDDGVSDSTWKSFLGQSGWVQNPASKTGLFRGRDFNDSSTAPDNSKGWYRSTNTRSRFAEAYGGTNPMEDWATTWELYFAKNRSTSATDKVLSQKLKLVDKLIKLA